MRVFVTHCMKSRKSEIHESRRYGRFYGIIKSATKIVIPETAVQTLIFAFMMSTEDHLYQF